MSPRRFDTDDRRDPFAALERHLNDMIGRYLSGALHADDGETRVFGYRTETGPDGLRIEAFGDPESVRAVRDGPDDVGGPARGRSPFRGRPDSGMRDPAEAAPSDPEDWRSPPRIEVRDRDGVVQIVVDLPGVSAAAIEAEAVRDRLAVTAIGAGVRYRDEIHLDEVDPDSLEVLPEDGRLVARLARA